MTQRTRLHKFVITSSSSAADLLRRLKNKYHRVKYSKKTKRERVDALQTRHWLQPRTEIATEAEIVGSDCRGIYNGDEVLVKDTQEGGRCVAERRWSGATYRYATWTPPECHPSVHLAVAEARGRLHEQKRNSQQHLLRDAAEISTSPTSYSSCHSMVHL